MAGMENDPSGLYHANARYYSPALTRFLSEDPERGKANMFTYAGENAITGSDVSGMDDCPLGDCAGGGDIGSGGSSGSGDDGFQELIQFLLGPFSNFLSTSSSATPTIMNYAGPQLEARFGNSLATVGMQGNAGSNLYSESDAKAGSLYGIASYYEPTGNLTRSGLPYNDRNDLIAAMHPDVVGFHGRFPYGTKADVTYTPPGSKIPRTVTVRVIDKGATGLNGRLIDLSPGAFEYLSQQTITPGVRARPGLIMVHVELPAKPMPPLQ
jgi:RHS repeat-associated protein